MLMGVAPMNTYVSKKRGSWATQGVPMCAEEFFLNARDLPRVYGIKLA